MEWEDKMAIKRSQGHFFQSLYRIKRQLPDGSKPNSPPVQVGLTSNMQGACPDSTPAVIKIMCPALGSWVVPMPLPAALPLSPMYQPALGS